MQCEVKKSQIQHEWIFFKRKNVYGKKEMFTRSLLHNETMSGFYFLWKNVSVLL